VVSEFQVFDSRLQTSVRRQVVVIPSPPSVWQPEAEPQVGLWNSISCAKGFQAVAKRNCGRGPELWEIARRHIGSGHPLSWSGPWRDAVDVPDQFQPPSPMSILPVNYQWNNCRWHQSNIPLNNQCLNPLPLYLHGENGHHRITKNPWTDSTKGSVN
jgi:hypothetical protein